MEFGLSKEHLLAQQLYRSFAEKEVKPLAQELDEEERFPWETVKKMAKYGMMGIPIPKEYGGQGALKPTVAFPHLPENTHPIDEVGDIAIDQVVIGSCTNGRLEDLRIAAEIMQGRKIAKGLRVIVIPATQKIYLDAMEAGYIRAFIEAGAIVSTPTCGPCLGGYMGILAEGERCVSTTNRNFVGRMGHVTSEIYLASPAVAAASAITGKISCPCELD